MPCTAVYDVVNGVLHC